MTKLRSNWPGMQAPRMTPPPSGGQVGLTTDKVRIRPQAKRPSGKPLARMPTPSIPYRAKKNGLSEELVKRLQNVSDLFGGRFNLQQKKALKDMHQLLEPNKFGGKDRTFNYGDQRAIVSSLMKDERGLSKIASKRLERDGKKIRAGLVEKAFSNRPGLIGGVVKDRVMKSAPRRIENQIARVLKRAKVDSKTSSYYDDYPRDVTFKDAAKFQRSINVFRGMKREAEKRLRVKLVFPKGISQDFVEHVIKGRAGFPPGVAFRDLG